MLKELINLIICKIFGHRLLPPLKGQITTCLRCRTNIDDTSWKHLK